MAYVLLMLWKRNIQADSGAGSSACDPKFDMNLYDTIALFTQYPAPSIIAYH